LHGLWIWWQSLSFGLYQTSQPLFDCFISSSSSLLTIVVMVAGTARTLGLLVLSVLSGTASAQTFTTRSMCQSNPIAGSSNTITVTIQTDVNLAQADSSVVTISGLINAPDAASLALASVENSMANMLFWEGTTQGEGALSSGTLTLTLFTGKTVLAGTQYAFSFTITNPSGAQDAPTVTIAASGTASIPPTWMVAPDSPLLGVAKGSKPLLVMLPEFQVRKIGQSNPLAGGSNTITVTIQSNVNLAQSHGSVVTIVGLTNAPDTWSLALTSVENHGADLFSDGTTQGMGSLISGTLTLKVHRYQTVMAGMQYAFSFTILNPITEQDATTVTIEASGTAEFPYDRGAMSTDTADLNRVTNGGKPITVVSK
jgi:hypothetical protein